MEPENLQTVLLEAGIQVDMKNLQNPTEDFMIYLITEYLKKFNFDGNEISKSTEEQLDCLACPDSAIDAIKVINLYSAMASVCNEIFLKDFCLTDITSPGPKRARKHIKMLFNFFAYVKNKMVENEIAFIDLENQKQDIENMVEEKNSVIVKIGASIGDRENKMELKCQLQEELDDIRINVDNNNKISRELEYRIQEIREQQQEAFKRNRNLKERVLKLHKVTTELQSKIVRSPEEYAARTKELSKALEIKKEERQVLTDSITKKKQQIENNEHAQVLVKDLNDKFVAYTSSIIKELKETSMKLESIQKEFNLLKEDITKWTHMEMNLSLINAKDEDLKGHELLFELDNQYVDRDRELNSQKLQLQELKEDLIKRKAILEDELKIIVSIQENNSNNIEKYKQYFYNEISEELTLRELITNSLLKTGSGDF